VLGSVGRGLIASRPAFQSRRNASARWPLASLPPAHTTPPLWVTLTPYPSGRGSFPALFHFPPGLSSTKTLSYQTFFPPSQGLAPGKFAPPATSSAPLLTPANEPANPSRSGKSGNCDEPRAGPQPVMSVTSKSVKQTPSGR